MSAFSASMARLRAEYPSPRHPGEGDEAARREAFVALRLVPPLAGAAVLPLLLAGPVVPGLWAGALALLVPLVPALLARRGLDLDAARLAETALYALVAGLLVLLLGAGALPFAAWGVALPLVGAGGRTRAVAAATALGTIAAACWVAGPHGLAAYGPTALATGFAALAFGAAHLAGEADKARGDLAEAAVWRGRAEVLLPRAGDLVLRAERGGLCREAHGPGLAGLGAPEALLGTGFLTHLVVGDRPAFLKAMGDALADGSPRRERLRLQTLVRGEGDRPVPESRTWAVDVEVAPLGPAPARDAYVTVRDARPLRAAEEELAVAKAGAAMAHETAARLVATVSHELRTPLNAVIGFASMLADPALCPADPDERTDYARIVASSGRHLLEVVNALLDASALAGGRLKLSREEIDAAPIVSECLDLLRLKAAEARVTLILDLAPDLPRVNADGRALRQIVLNLAGNALKFTPPGGRVRVTLAPRGSGLDLAVEDTGIGIGAGDLGRVGQPFFQASSGHARSREGTGLGLSVVHGLAGLHGGEVVVESAPGAGTRVLVRLPLDGGEGAPETATIRPIRARARRAVVRAVA